MLLVLLLAMALQAADTRQQPAAAPDNIDIDQLLARLHAHGEEYERTFRNLSAEETKIIEVFDASGEVEKRREILSDLLVYSAARQGKEARVEYRDVRMVDGKAIEKRGERALKLLTNAAKADSLEKELEAIHRETLRYEFRRHLRGFAIHHSAFPKEWRGTHKVEWAGRELIAEREVIVLDYRQTAAIPGVNRTFRLPRELGKPLVLARGRLWLDASTGQLWRSVWELVVPHPAIPEPLTLVRAEKTFVSSRFGILVPERIVFDWFQRFTHPKKGRPAFSLSERATFTYGAFKRFDVATSETIRDSRDQ
jgi:hypothetical protein